MRRRDRRTDAEVMASLIAAMRASAVRDPDSALLVDEIERLDLALWTLECL